MTNSASENHSLDELARDVAARFAERFRRPPRWIAAAPGRVNLIGEHVDYNGGFVLPMAIERFTVIAADAAPEHSGEIRLASADFQEETTFRLHSQMTPGAPPWSNYVRGVLAGCLARGFAIPGLDALVASTVPIGGGLSSSAALEVATATLAEAIAGESLETAAKALLCQRAEHEFAGVPCGIMDQFIVAGARHDHAMLLDCRSMEFEFVPFAKHAVTVLTINSHVRHSLAGGEYGKRRAECETAARILGMPTLREATLDDLNRRRNELGPEIFRRARHVVGEIERTTAAARAIAAEDWPAVGAAMYASHASLRDDFEVSCDELNLLVDFAAALGPERGVLGSRMTGGGFGGCTVSLVRADAVDAVARSIGQSYREQTGIEATSFSTRPAGGARVLPLTHGS
ncbi:MAG TPA: galactokinase [Pirellulales bacterium]|nr:galactokinase [Pirellulales bacterium]